MRAPEAERELNSRLQQQHTRYRERTRYYSDKQTVSSCAVSGEKRVEVSGNSVL